MSIRRQNTLSRQKEVFTPADPQRRRYIENFALMPIALAVLGACSKSGNWPEGMQAIKWDRDTCVRCNMVISDRRFAAEMRGGERDTVFKFDDVGCLIFWMRNKANQFPWMGDPATRMWVADFDGKGEHWLDPRHAKYLAGRASPMGYNYAAIVREEASELDFPALRQLILARGK